LKNLIENDEEFNNHGSSDEDEEGNFKNEENDNDRIVTKSILELKEKINMKK
jgi:hypothetical protein